MFSNSMLLMKFWRERVVWLIVAQIVQGVTPQQIALTIALGFSLGIFPILGATTALCTIVGVCLKLNQPIIQMMNWLVPPLKKLAALKASMSHSSYVK